MVENINLDGWCSNYLEDVYIQKSPISFVSFSRINTKRTFWTIGTINFLEDENSLKEAMARSKEKLGFHDWSALNSKEPMQKRYTVIGFCSIPQDQWNETTRFIEKLLKQVYPCIEFAYSLRGKNHGQIAFDEQISKSSFIDKQGNNTVKVKFNR